MVTLEHPRAPARALRRPRDRWTLVALGMFFLGVSVAGSVIVEFRIEFVGLLIHPYLLPLALLTVLVAMRRLNLLPPRIFLPLLGFLALYVLSTLPARGALSESLKILTSAGTITAVALLVRNRAEFQAGALGLAAAAAIISMRGLAGADGGILGIDPIGDIANRNAFSLYALPSLLIGSFLALDKSVRPFIRFLVAGCAAVTLVAIFSTGNRSGWLGALLIMLMIYSKGRRFRAVVFVGVLAAVCYGMLMKFSSIAVLEHRVEQTLAGYHSDRLRRVLFQKSIGVGLEYPLLGVSPQKLPFELARRLNALAPEVDAHNMLGHIMGGSGVITTLAFLTLGAMLWLRRRGVRPPPEGKLAHRLLRMMLLLFFVRGMFSREILYAPSFSIGLGLCIGYCLLTDVWRAPVAPRQPIVERSARVVLEGSPTS